MASITNTLAIRKFQGGDYVQLELNRGGGSCIGHGAHGDNRRRRGGRRHEIPRLEGPVDTYSRSASHATVSRPDQAVGTWAGSAADARVPSRLGGEHC